MCGATTNMSASDFSLFVMSDIHQLLSMFCVIISEKHFFSICLTFHLISGLKIKAVEKYVNLLDLLGDPPLAAITSTKRFLQL